MAHVMVLKPKRPVRERATVADAWWRTLDAGDKDFLRAIGYLVARANTADNGQVVEVTAGTQRNGKERFLRVRRMSDWGEDGRRLTRPRAVESLEHARAAEGPGEAPRAVLGFAADGAAAAKSEGGEK
jgi:hypothetical protein